MADAKVKKSSKDILSELNSRLTTIHNINTVYTETNCAGFDLGISNGKGLPQGWAISMYAPPGCGKSTLCADVIYRLISANKEKGMPYKVVYIDVEGSKELLKSMGLTQYMCNGDLLHYEGGITFDGLEALYDAILTGEGIYEGVKLIVIDSITAVNAQRLMDISCSDADFGSNAKERARFYPKYLTKCKEKGITNIFISQVRTNQNAGVGGDPRRAAMSDVDKHWMDIMVKFSKKENSQLKDIKKIKIKTAFGVIETQNRFILTMSSSIAKDTKNRAGRIPNVDLLVEYGKRVINTYTIRDMLDGLGYIKLGPYCTVGPELLEEFDPENKEGLVDANGKAKSVRLKDVNKFVKNNLKGIKDFLKSRDQYKLDIATEGEGAEDDGM